MISQVIPLGQTPSHSGSLASRRNRVLINETESPLKDFGIYKAEVSCSANNPVFGVIFHHRKRGEHIAGFFVPQGIYCSEVISIDDTIYVRVVSEYEEK